jgi:hypothetical protein
VCVRSALPPTGGKTNDAREATEKSSAGIDKNI